MSNRDDGGPAFPFADQGFNATSGMSLRAYAAINLRVPDSGIDWLDDMIRHARRDEFAAHVLAGPLALGGKERDEADDRSIATDAHLLASEAAVESDSWRA